MNVSRREALECLSRTKRAVNKALVMVIQACSTIRNSWPNPNNVDRNVMEDFLVIWDVGRELRECKTLLHVDIVPQILSQTPQYVVTMNEMAARLETLNMFFEMAVDIHLPIFVRQQTSAALRQMDNICLAMSLEIDKCRFIRCHIPM